MNTILTAPVTSRSGYGDKSRDIASYLIDHYGEDIDILATRWGDCSLDGLTKSTEDEIKIEKRIIPHHIQKKYDVSFQIGLPHEFKQLCKYNIGITSGIETDICGDASIYGCNRMNLVIVPSSFTKKTFESTICNDGTRCKVPIEVLFEPYDDLITDATDDNLVTQLLDNLESDFNFLTIGQITKNQDRKNIKKLIKIFCEIQPTLNQSPQLILKIHGTHYNSHDEREIIEIVKRSCGGIKSPPIKILYGNLTKQELHTLYTHKKIKSMISLTRGEGFGRPLLESSVNGLPTIATKWSGHLDFLDKKYCKLIPGKLVPAEGFGSLIPPEAMWFDVDECSVKQEIEDMINRYEIHKKRADKLKINNKNKFNKEKMKSEFDKIIAKYI